ncbi:hypothetical protein LXL04_015868 [Taraxacum kok-saghyz]
MWRSITEGPHVITGVTRTEPTIRIVDEGEEVEHVPIPLDLEKTHADKQALIEIIFDIPPYLYECVTFCTTMKEVWDRLQDLLLKIICCALCISNHQFQFLL